MNRSTVSDAVVPDIEGADVDVSAAADGAEDSSVDTPSAAELVAQISDLRAEYDVLQRELEASTKLKRKVLHRPSRQSVWDWLRGSEGSLSTSNSGRRLAP